MHACMYVYEVCTHQSRRLQMGINLSTIVTGHGTLRSYYHRLKITDDPKCVGKMGPQTTDHLLWECELLRKQREVLKNRIKTAGGNWPITNSNLANKHTKLKSITFIGRLMHISASVGQ